MSWKPDPFTTATVALQASWGGSTGLCLSPVLPDRQMSKQVGSGSSRDSAGALSMAKSGLVSHTLGITPILLPQRQDLLKDAFGKNHPLMVS